MMNFGTKIFDNYNSKPNIDFNINNDVDRNINVNNDINGGMNFNVDRNINVDRNNVDPYFPVFPAIVIACSDEVSEYVTVN